MHPVLWYAAAALVAITPLGAQTSPTWRYTANAPISFFSVTTLGTVLVATADGLVSLDPDSGTIIWTRNDLSDLAPTSVVAISHSPFATVHVGQRIELIDLATGTTRWSTPSWADLEPYLPVPEHGVILAYGSTDSAKHVLAAVELESGAVRWQRAQPFDLIPGGLRFRGPGIVTLRRDSGGPEPALWVSDTTFLLHIPRHGPVLMHAGTGEWLWGADKLKGWSMPLLSIPAWSRGATTMLLRDSVVYVPFEGKLHALRVRDGMPLWGAAPNFPAPITQLELTTRGLVVRQGFGLGQKGQRASLKLIDPATGKSRWSKRFGNALQQPHPMSTFLVEDGRVLIAANNKLLAISLDDGTTTEITRFKFEGGEHPILLKRRGDALLLIGKQNLMLLDSTGAERYHAYHPAPGRSTLEKAGLVTLTTVAVAATLYWEVLGEGMNPDVPRREREDFFEGLDELPFPDLARRYAASEEAHNYVYSVAHEADSTGHKRPVFLRLQKDGGQVVGRVWLGEKRPNYTLDLIAGILYARDGSTEIRAFRF